MGDYYSKNDGCYVAPGSQTSEDAAASMEQRAGKLERLVYQVIEQAGSVGIADFEIDHVLAEHLAPGSTARPRRCKLRDRDHIRDTGRTVRNPQTGRPQTQWALARYVDPPGTPGPVLTTGAPPDPIVPPSAVERVLAAVEEDLNVCRTFWDRPDMEEGDRLHRMAYRLEHRALEFRRQADHLKRQQELAATGQSSLALETGGA